MDTQSINLSVFTCNIPGFSVSTSDFDRWRGVSWRASQLTELSSSEPDFFLVTCNLPGVRGGYRRPRYYRWTVGLQADGATCSWTAVTIWVHSTSHSTYCRRHLVEEYHWMYSKQILFYDGDRLLKRMPSQTCNRDTEDRHNKTVN